MCIELTGNKRHQRVWAWRELTLSLSCGQQCHQSNVRSFRFPCSKESKTFTKKKLFFHFRQTPSVSVFINLFSCVHYKHCFLLKKKRDWFMSRCHFGVLQGDVHSGSPMHWDLLTTPETQGGITECWAGRRAVALTSLAFLQAPYKNLEDHVDCHKSHFITACQHCGRWVPEVRLVGRGCKRASYIILAFLVFSLHWACLSPPKRVGKSLSSLHCSIFWFFILWPQLLCTFNNANFSHCFKLSSQEKSSYVSNNVLCTQIFI